MTCTSRITTFLIVSYRRSRVSSQCTKQQLGEKHAIQDMPICSVCSECAFLALVPYPTVGSNWRRIRQVPQSTDLRLLTCTVVDFGSPSVVGVHAGGQSFARCFFEYSAADRHGRAALCPFAAPSINSFDDVTS